LAAQPGFAGFYFAYDNVTLNPGVIYRIVLAAVVLIALVLGVVS